MTGGPNSEPSPIGTTGAPGPNWGRFRTRSTEPRPAVRWWRRARRTPALVAGAIILAVMVVLAVFAPLIAPYDPSAQDLAHGLQPPSGAHWFGTDQLGRDILSRVIAAAGTDLRIAVLAAATPFVVGVVLGLVSGYAGGRLDWVIGRVVDTFVAFPFYVLVIAVVFAAGTGERGIYVAYALVGWISYARVVRARTRTLCREGWVQAAYGGGLSHPRVIARHVLPNVLPLAVVLLMTEILLIMVAVVTLGYLGLGVQPPTPDWGTMISDGQLFLTTRWWVPTLPGIAVVTTGVGLSLLGDGLADVWRLR